MINDPWRTIKLLNPAKSRAGEPEPLKKNKEPEPLKNLPAPQPWQKDMFFFLYILRSCLVAVLADHGRRMDVLRVLLEAEQVHIPFLTFVTLVLVRRLNVV